MKLIHRILLLLTALLASYQVVQGIDGLETMAIACYTIAFGVLIVAALLMIILGFEVLDSPLVVVASTLIPVSLALGLVSEYLDGLLIPYGIFIVIGTLTIIITRFAGPKKLAVIVLAVVHGAAGLTIFALPIILALRGVTAGGFAWVGIGGGLIGIGGLLLSFLKTGKPILSRETILTVLPGLLLLTTAAFVAGFMFV
ncbi:MAG: hypothetical protein ISS57_02725 [Anaerolineales bacterium]|nr:hypothetical protein [Anaerolineales bacterium]